MKTHKTDKRNVAIKNDLVDQISQAYQHRMGLNRKLRNTKDLATKKDLERQLFLIDEAIGRLEAKRKVIG